MDPGHRKAGGGKRGQGHVQRLLERGGVQHGRDGIDVGDLAADDLESGRRVHPRIGGHHEDSRGHPAQGHRHSGPDVRQRRDPVPAVEIDPEEDGLGEEGKALQRERHPDDPAGVLHELRPQQDQLEGQHRSRDGADREQDRGPFRPPLGQLEIDPVAGLLPTPLRDDHQHRHGDPDHGENDVEGERDGHLGAGGEEVGHGAEGISERLKSHRGASSG